MKQDNRGVTLVEMIIVVAIMSVILGVAGLGLGLVSGKPAEKCAKNITAELQRCRTLTTGKFAAACYLYRDSTTQEVKVMQRIQKTSTDSEETFSDVVVGDSDVSVKVKYGDGSEAELSTALVKVSFNRGTGALDTTGTYCVGFEVSKGSTVKTITIVPLTGRITEE